MNSCDSILQNQSKLTELDMRGEEISILPVTVFLPPPAPNKIVSFLNVIVSSIHLLFAITVIVLYISCLWFVTWHLVLKHENIILDLFDINTNSHNRNRRKKLTLSSAYEFTSFRSAAS